MASARQKDFWRAALKIGGGKKISAEKNGPGVLKGPSKAESNTKA